MIPKLLLAAFLLAHGAIHTGFLARPPTTAGGPPWPFEMTRSWLVPAGMVGEAPLHLAGVGLVALTVTGFALAALAALGIAPTGLWAPATGVGAVASLALLVLFFHPWLVVGVALDAILLWAALVLRWTPAGT